MFYTMVVPTCTESISCLMAIMSRFTSHTSVWQDSTLEKTTDELFLGWECILFWVKSYLRVSSWSCPRISGIISVSIKVEKMLWMKIAILLSPERATWVSTFCIPFISSSFPVRLRFMIFICFCSLSNIWWSSASVSSYYHHHHHHHHHQHYLVLAKFASAFTACRI